MQAEGMRDLKIGIKRNRFYGEQGRGFRESKGYFAYGYVTYIGIGDEKAPNTNMQRRPFGK